jgi:Protein of unknown function (DUF4245)
VGEDSVVDDRATTDVPVVGQVVKPKRAAATLLDMVRSLGVLVIVVAVTLIFVPELLHPNKSERFQAADYSDYVAGFQQVTGLSALVPTGLAKPWYANAGSLKYSGKTAHLHIGWVTPNKEYAALEESNGPASSFVTAVIGAPGLKVTGTQLINGSVWSRSVSAQGEGSLTRTTNGITVVITGSASLAQQEQLAASLA